MNSDILILIVDDNQHNVQVLGGLLVGEGFKLAVANCGLDALRFLERKRPDLILLDISMPVMDGFEVCRRIKSNSDLRDIPIIFISALNATSDKVKAFDIGGADYVTKPFESSELLARVRTHLKISRLNEQLLQSHKMEAVGRLAGGIAHDLNNMLQGVIGYGDMIVNESMSIDCIKRIVKEMLINAEHSADLVKQLLRFAQRDINIFKEHDINTIIRNSLPGIEDKVGDNIDVVLDLAEEELIALVDSEQIEQVLMNLTKNSVDAMPKGGKIHISTKVIDVLPNNYSFPNLKDGRYVKITFEDDGYGMREEVQEHVFEPFFTEKDIGEGVGMGLATVFAVVKQHHGEIELDSDEGVGTTVNIYIPVNVREKIKPEAAENNDSEISANTAKEESRAKTVLIVEDNMAINKLARLILNEAGYNTLSATTGEDAVDIFRSNKEVIDVMLIDIITPDMTGPEVYELICLEKEIPVIFCSGYDKESLRENYNLHIKDQIIKKPYSDTVLLDAVENAIGGSDE